MTRDRDLSFEKLAEVCGVNVAQLEPQTRGAFNASLKSIRLAMPELEDHELQYVIEAKARVYRKVFENAPLTPTALSKHWASLDGLLSAQQEAVPRTNATADRAHCPTCEGMGFVLASYRPPEGVDLKTYKPERDGFEEWTPCRTCNPTGGQIVREYLERFDRIHGYGPRETPEAVKAWLHPVE